MNDITQLGLVCTSVCLFGFYAAYLYGRRTKSFKWSKYFMIIIWPLVSIALLIFMIDWKILSLFIVSMVVGTVFEYFLGFVYEKTLNKRLWKYERMSLHGYTSLLSIPLWGVAGVVFWSIGKILGLQ